METIEVVTDNSMPHDTISGVPSNTSYNDHHSVVPSDNGSVASNSLQGTATSALSPSRSPRSGPTSPTSAAGSNAVLSATSFHQQPSVDLLDSHASGYPTTRDRSGGLNSSDDDHTEPSSSATGNTVENPPGYTRSDFTGSATSTFGRLIESTKVSTSSRGACGRVFSAAVSNVVVFCHFDRRDVSILLIDGDRAEMTTMMTKTT